MYEDELRLTDIVDFTRLQQLQDNMASATGLSVMALDAHGEPLTRPSRPAAFCSMVDTALGEEHTCHSRLQIPDALLEGKVVRLQCPYSGMTNVHIPFVCQGEYLGCWVLYQTRTEHPPLSQAVLSSTALQLGLQADMLIGAAEMLPQFTGRELDIVIHMFEGLTAALLGNLTSEAPPETLLARVEQTVAKLGKFMNAPEIGMLASDYDTGEVLLVNARYADWVGEDRGALAGRRVEELRAQDFDAFYSSCTEEKGLDLHGEPVEPLQWSDYSTRHGAWLRCTNQLVYWPDGRLAHLVTFRDITDERRTQDELSRLAFYDRQMNLPNSLKLALDLEQVFDNVRAKDEYLICFDINSLRTLNDAHGRKAGDAFLRTVIKWLDHQSLPESTVYRIEGDAFCVRITGQGADEVVAAAQRIYARFSDLWSLMINGQQISILCGVSLSVIGLDSLKDNDELLNVIQRTLDISRKESKIVIYDEDTDRELKTHIQMQLSLKKCVKQRMHGFEVYYQPIVEPTTGLWKGLEALCRWNSPEVGEVAPLVFIREAEQLGLINQIGEWVLETSVCQYITWGLDKLDGVFLSVNLSPVQIMSTSLINSTLEILQRNGFPGSKLCLEVTESTRLNFNNHTLGVIENLCNHGIQIALDDFGTGYSTFNNMKNLPVKFVKTDHDFIRGIERDSYMQYFYHIITELAHKTGMKLVVEGVETQEQLEIMLKNGVDYVQGFYFGHPMPPAEIETQLRKFTFAKPPFRAGLNRLEPDQSLAPGKEGYLISTGTFNVQTQCMQILLAEPDINKAINEVLALVGTHFRSSRAYVFLRDWGHVYSNTHEWCAPGVLPQKPVLREVDIAATSPSWLPMLEKDGMLVASDITHLPDDIAKPMAAQDIRALAILPLQENGEVAGFIGLDDCSNYRHWQSEEIVMLKNLSLLMASGLKKQLAAAAPQDMAVAAAMEALDFPAFICDLESGDILWANARLEAQCGGLATGEKCYRLLQHCDNRCDSCRARALADLPGETMRRLVEQGDSQVLVFNRLVEWADGRQALLEYSVELGINPVETPMAGLETLRIALETERADLAAEALGTELGFSQ